MTPTKKTTKLTGNTIIRINSFMNVSVKEKGDENTATSIVDYLNHLSVEMKLNTQFPLL